jgi:hypothetical protein
MKLKKRNLVKISLFGNFLQAFKLFKKRNEENYQHMVKLFCKRKTQSSEV